MSGLIVIERGEARVAWTGLEFLRLLCNPEVGGRYDLRTPWREGPIAWATDGAILGYLHESHADPDRFAALPAADASRPPRMGDTIQRLGPFHPRPLDLPTVFTAPERERADCPLCARRRGFLPCSTCGGTGKLPRAGVGIDLVPPASGIPGLGIDAWYFTLLRRAGAELTASVPDPSSPGRIGPFRFKVGHVTGFVQPYVIRKPRVPCPPPA